MPDGCSQNIRNNNNNNYVKRPRVRRSCIFLTKCTVVKLLPFLLSDYQDEAFGFHADLHVKEGFGISGVHGPITPVGPSTATTI